MASGGVATARGLLDATNSGSSMSAWLKTHSPGEPEEPLALDDTAWQVDSSRGSVDDPDTIYLGTMVRIRSLAF